MAALADSAHRRGRTAHNAGWLPWFTDELRGLGSPGVPQRGNFVLLRFADAAARRGAPRAFLQAAGIIVAPMAAYGLPDCLRITDRPRGRGAGACSPALGGESHEAAAR